MALFVLGDTHLSLGGSKPMDVFPGWNGYVERLEANWRKLVKPEDTIVLAGDISWAMRLTDTRRDFAISAAAARPEAHHEGQPRLLVDHRQQDERLPESRGLRYAPHPAQQLLLRGGLRHLRHPGLAVRCGGASRRKGDEPGDRPLEDEPRRRRTRAGKAGVPALPAGLHRHQRPRDRGDTEEPTASGPATTAICTAMPSAMRCRAMWTASATSLSALTVCGSAPTASTEAETRTAEMTKSQNLGWQFYHDRAIISCDAIVAPNLSARVPAFRKQQGRGARLQAAVFPLPQRNRIFEWRIHK